MFDDSLVNVNPDLVLVYVRGVLGGDDDGIHTLGDTVLVLHRHLALTVGAQIGQVAILANPGQLLGQLVSQDDGHRHKFGGFIASKADHHTLIASTNGLNLRIAHLASFGLQRLIDTQRNIGTLLFYGNDHATRLAVEAIFGACIADITYRLAGNLDVIYLS